MPPPHAPSGSPWQPCPSPTLARGTFCLSQAICHFPLAEGIVPGKSLQMANKIVDDVILRLIDVPEVFRRLPAEQVDPSLYTDLSCRLPTRPIPAVATIPLPAPPWCPMLPNAATSTAPCCIVPLPHDHQVATALEPFLLRIGNELAHELAARSSLVGLASSAIGSTAFNATLKAQGRELCIDVVQQVQQNALHVFDLRHIVTSGIQATRL